MRSGACVTVTRNADVRSTDAVAPVSHRAAPSPAGGERMAYEWSRPRLGPGAKRTRTTEGVSAESATVPCALWNTQEAPSRRGADIASSELQPAAARDAGRTSRSAQASASRRRVWCTVSLLAAHPMAASLVT